MLCHLPYHLPCDRCSLLTTTSPLPKEFVTLLQEHGFVCKTMLQEASIIDGFFSFTPQELKLYYVYGSRPD